MSTAWRKKTLLVLGVAFNAAYLTYYGLSGSSGGGSPTYARTAPSVPAPRVVSFYARAVNQTNVYPSEDLLLIDEPGRRLLLSPTFTVSGADAAAPQTVLLRFYSFSKARQYAVSQRRLRLAADGEEIWSGTDVIYSATYGDDGEVVESLGSQMPFDAFARAAGGEVVKVTVGSEEIELSSGQLLPLRSMARCARTGMCYGWTRLS